MDEKTALEVAGPEEPEALEPETGEADSTLTAIIDRVLEKGLVVNADIAVSVADTELLGIKIRAALASFETAAKYGLQFPSGTNMETAAWKEAVVGKEHCPNCGKRAETEKLLDSGCLWCGWRSAKAKKLAAQEISK